MVVLVSSTLGSPLNFPTSNIITPSLGKEIKKAVLSLTAQNTELQIFLTQLSNESLQIGDRVLKTLAQTLNIEPPTLQRRTTTPDKPELYSAFNTTLYTAWPKLKPLSTPISEGYTNLIDQLTTQSTLNTALQLELELDENGSPIATIISSAKIPATIKPRETLDIIKQIGVPALEASPRSNETTFTITIPKRGVDTVEYGGTTMKLDTSNPNSIRLTGQIPAGTHIQSLWIRTIPTLSLIHI